MTRNIFFLLIILLGLVTPGQADTLTADGISIQAGDTVNVPVSFSSSESNLVGFQMDVYLPQGIHINRSLTKLSERFGNNASITVGKQGSGHYRLIYASLDLKPLSGKSGVLFNLFLVADSTSESGKATFKDILFGTSEGKSITVESTSFSITRTNYSNTEILSVPAMTAHHGDSIKMKVDLTNSLSNLSAYQFDIYLPDGFDVAKDEDGSYYVLLNSERHNKIHTWMIDKLNDSYYRVLVYSIKNALLSGKSGTLLTIPVVTNSNVTYGNYAGRIKNIIFYTNRNDDDAIYLRDVNFKITVEAFEAGDVNHDGSVSIKDLIMIANYIKGQTQKDFDASNAEVNGDGSVNVKDLILVANKILNVK